MCPVELKIEFPLIQIVLILVKFDAIAVQKGKESHINQVNKIFIKDEFTLIIIFDIIIKIK
jgi:hypothetical protein